MGGISWVSRQNICLALSRIGFLGFLIWSAAIPFAQLQTTRFTGIGLFSLLGAFLFQLPFGFKIRALSKEIWIFIIIWMLFALSPLFDFWRWHFPSESLGQIQLRLPMIFAPFVVWQLAPHWPRNWVSTVLWVLGMGLVMNMAYTLRLGPEQIWTTLHSERPNQIELGMNRPYYGLLTGTFSFLILLWFSKSKWYWVVLLTVPLVGFLVLVLAKFALISWALTALVGLFIWFYFHFSQKFSRIGLSLFAFFVIGFSFHFFLDSALWNDIKTSGEIRYETLPKTYSNSANTRLIIWKASLEILSTGQNWVWGLGTANAQEKLDEIYQRVNFHVYEGHFSAHNLLIFIALQYGLLGLVVFLTGFWYLIKLTIRPDDWLPLLVWIFIFLCCQTEIFLNREMGVHFILWTSIVLVFRQTEDISGRKP